MVANTDRVYRAESGDNMDNRLPPPHLDDIPNDVTPKEVLYELRMFRYEVQPAVLFYIKAQGVIGVLRWLGPVTTLLLAAILVAIVSTAP